MFTASDTSQRQLDHADRYYWSMTRHDRALTLEQDPASSRLTQEKIIQIHQMHRGGIPWDDIADEMRIDRKNVQRIVQGRRHADLHPLRRPDLYGDEHTPVAEKVFTQTEVREAMDAALKAFWDALSRRRS
jgi:hypothetical protein